MLPFAVGMVAAEPDGYPRPIWGGDDRPGFHRRFIKGVSYSFSTMTSASAKPWSTSPCTTLTIQQVAIGPQAARPVPRRRRVEDSWQRSSTSASAACRALACFGCDETEGVLHAAAITGQNGLVLALPTCFSRNVGWVRTPGISSLRTCRSADPQRERTADDGRPAPGSTGRWRKAEAGGAPDQPAAQWSY
jgi:hypothetical protein